MDKVKENQDKNKEKEKETAKEKLQEAVLNNPLFDIERLMNELQ